MVEERKRAASIDEAELDAEYTDLMDLIYSGEDG